MVLASRNIDTGCRVVNVMEFLDDSPFFAELERGLGESWRETEAMKFCSAVVYGGGSNNVLKLAGRGMRSGPWMTIQANREAFPLPGDLERPSPKRPNTNISKMGRQCHLRKTIVSPRKGCVWREQFLQRKRIQKFLGRLCQDVDDGEGVCLNVDIGGGEKIVEPLRKQARGWWTFLGKRLYGVRERTLQLD